MPTDVDPTAAVIQLMKAEATNTNRGDDFQAAAWIIITEVEPLLNVENILSMLACFENAARRLRNKVEMM